MRNALLAAGIFFCSLVAAGTASAQAGNGALDLVARITPTAARPEPVRQFTFYVLTKSYEDITKDVEASDAPPDRDKFISELKVSDELKEWLKGHDEFDLTSPIPCAKANHNTPPCAKRQGSSSASALSWNKAITKASPILSKTSTA